MYLLSMQLQHALICETLSIKKKPITLYRVGRKQYVD